MYNKTMKKISVLLVLALFFCCSIQTPCQAGFFAEQKAKIEYNRANKATASDIKKLIQEQNIYANKHDLEGILTLYCSDFVNSDGFKLDIYKKLIEETWEIYPDITYETKIKNIDFSDNYATVLVQETAVATQKEYIDGEMHAGELYSVSECVYYLEKHGLKWFINSEKIIEETSTLKYGGARYLKIELNTPKQVASGKYYTATLKIEAPEGCIAVGSIGKENIVYPQVKMEDAYRKLSQDNILERVFLSNKDNVNEYAVASVMVTQPPEYMKNGQVRIYMGGMAFVMTRVNVIPENKFIKEKKNGED